VSTVEWGVEVTLVELKDIQLPDSMKRAMAKQAEAEREKRQDQNSDFDVHDIAEKTVADAVSRALGPVSDVRVRTQVTEGNPAQVLLDAAASADLLVVGSRGHGGFTEALLGSVSQRFSSESLRLANKTKTHRLLPRGYGSETFLRGKRPPVCGLTFELAASNVLARRAADLLRRAEGRTVARLLRTGSCDRDTSRWRSRA
jgi:nucleotide-binding universal stress UspA family protein